ncbi:MAG: hypothetical protein CO170_02045 [candidate division SR1 bacterium CG_4_9_14_3_um_filter_40_9]|nr:MAG: hypothetical protein CO170_02045 [candidate division SR1 bacterium CG_4_9_14_3_um_filter_40_9]
MTIAPIELKDVKIDRFYNNVDKAAVVDAVNENLLNLSNDVLDEQKKKEIINAITSGKVQTLQILLGMEKGRSKKSADNKFGDYTLDILKKGKVLESQKNPETSSGANLSLTKEKYLELLKSENKEKLVKYDDNGTMLENCLLHPLQELTINISQKNRTVTTTDALTFDFSQKIKEADVEPAFRKIKDVLDAYSQEPSNIQTNYSYDKTSKTWKKGVADVIPGNTTTVEPDKNVLVKTSYIGYEDIEEYLDPEVLKILPGDIEDKLDKKNIQEKEVNGQKVYTFGDTYLIHKDGMRGISLAGKHDYFRRKDRLGLKSKLTFSDKDNSLEDCFKLMAFINLIGATFKDKQTGTGEKAHIDKNDFSADFWSGNNPFYATGNKLYFNDAVSLDDYDLLRKSNLEDMVSGVSLENLAEFFTNRVDYKFDNAVYN